MNARFWTQGPGRILSAVLVIVVMLILWEGAVRFFHVKPFLLPAPSAVCVALWSKPVWYLRHAGYTLLETVLGFGGAVLMGVIMAVGIIYSRFIEQTLYTILVTLNAIPKIAIAPLFILWLGTDLSPKIAIALLVALFPIVIDTVLGLRTVDPDMIDLGRSMQGSRAQILWKIRAPSALPSLFAGLKVGISLAFIGAIVGEFVASQEGLGYVVMSSQANFDTAQMFAAILLLAVIGTVLFYAVELAETAMIPWHVSKRRGGGNVATVRF